MTGPLRTAQHWIAESFGTPAEVLRLAEIEVPSPGPGEVTIEVRAAGVNPADHKRFASGDPAVLPYAPGFEVAGTIAALGPDSEIASGGGAIGDEVLAFRVSGGYATALTVSAEDVFAKPAS
jgi:NADPH2:quinone reductase